MEAEHLNSLNSKLSSNQYLFEDYLNKFLPFLDSMKKYMINKCKTGLWNDALLNKIRQEYLCKDSQGKYKPYIGILLWYINKKASGSNKE